MSLGCILIKITLNYQTYIHFLIPVSYRKAIISSKDYEFFFFFEIALCKILFTYQKFAISTVLLICKTFISYHIINIRIIVTFCSGINSVCKTNTTHFTDEKRTWKRNVCRLESESSFRCLSWNGTLFLKRIILLLSIYNWPKLSWKQLVFVSRHCPWHQKHH